MAGIQINGAEQKLILDSDADTYLEAGTDDVVNFYAGGTNQYKFTNGAIVPITNNDIDLGTSSLEFKDIYSDGVIYLDAISYGGTTVGSTAAELNLLDGSAKSTSSITVGDTDAIIVIDGTTTKQIPASDIKTYTAGAVTALNNATQSELVTVGSTTTELDAEANLTFTGSALTCIGTVTVGVDDTGHDVKFFGATASKYMEWDESADTLNVAGTIAIPAGGAITNAGTMAPDITSTGKAMVLGL